MLIRTAGATLCAILLTASSALAMTVTNRDTADYTVTIAAGDNEVELDLPAGKSIENACESGCIVRLADGDEEVEAEAGDDLVIEAGKFKKAE